MRTKALLLAAAFVAAGIATSMAQSSNVYSLNVVGYVNVTLSPGYSIIENPLQWPGENVLSNVMPVVPKGSIIYDFASGGASSHSYNLQGSGLTNWGATGSSMSQAFLPGTGFFFKNPNTNNYTVTFVGNVMQGTLSNYVRGGGYTLIGSQVPQAGAIDSDLGYIPTASSTTVYRYASAANGLNGGTGGYVPYSYHLNGFGTNQWFSTFGVLSNTVAEGFWLKETHATNWVRTFTVQ